MFYAQKRLMEIGILYMASKNMMRKILLLLFALVIAFIIWSFSVVGGKIVFRYTGNLELDGSKIESTDNLYNFKYVRELSLYDWKIDDFEYLEVMKKLEKLSIDSDSLKEIIINNPKLTRLTLSIDSLEKISVSEECIKLEVVNINDCKRVEIDVDMFLKLESLKEIVIPKDSLNKSDINRLSNKGIEIESYDGTKKILY